MEMEATRTARWDITPPREYRRQRTSLTRYSCPEMEGQDHLNCAVCLEFTHTRYPPAVFFSNALCNMAKSEACSRVIPPFDSAPGCKRKLPRLTPSFHVSSSIPQSSRLCLNVAPFADLVVTIPNTGINVRSESTFRTINNPVFTRRNRACGRLHVTSPSIAINTIARKR